MSLPLILVRETGLEPVRCNHTPLKRARLPVPPLSHIKLRDFGCNHTPLKRLPLLTFGLSLTDREYKHSRSSPLSHETLVAYATRTLYITSWILSRAFLKKLLFFIAGPLHRIFSQTYILHRQGYRYRFPFEVTGRQKLSTNTQRKKSCISSLLCAPSARSQSVL